MLKYWLGLLLLLNAAVLAWQWDAFAHWGHGPNQQREPERLQQQINPEALKFELPLPTERPAAPAAAASSNAQAEAAVSDGAAPAAEVAAPAIAPTLPAASATAPAAPTPSALPATPR